MLGLAPYSLDAQEGYERVTMSINVNELRSLEIKVDDTSSVKGYWLEKIVYQLCNFVAVVKINNINQKVILKSLETDFQKQFNRAFMRFYDSSVKT